MKWQKIQEWTCTGRKYPFTVILYVAKFDMKYLIKLSDQVPFIWLMVLIFKLKGSSGILLILNYFKFLNRSNQRWSSSNLWLSLDQEHVLKYTISFCLGFKQYSPISPKYCKQPNIDWLTRIINISNTNHKRR